MEIIIPSKYVKAGENIQKGDIVKIKNEGEYKPGKFGPQLQFNLELPNGNIKTYTPNTQTLVNLKKEFGSDSRNYIDQPLKAWVFEQVKDGEVKLQLILTPREWNSALNEEGAPTKATGVNPNGTLPKDEDIDVKDIPF